MEWDAATPEELDALIEDAFVLRDAAALGRLFEDGGLMVVGDEPRPARGGAQIVRAAERVWTSGRGYVANAVPVIEARDCALMRGPAAIQVARRTPAGGWRLAISLLALHDDERR